MTEFGNHRFLRFYFSVFSVFLVSIEKIYQTLDSVFHHISKHLEVRQKYSAARRILISLLGVRKCDEKRCLVFDILHITIEQSHIKMLTNLLDLDNNLSLRDVQKRRKVQRDPQAF